MPVSTFNSPFVRKPASVQQVMFTVLIALLPAIAIYVWQFGVGILIQLALASIAALAAEAALLKIRQRPCSLFLGDLSAIVTAWLIALTFPPLVPWWLTVTATVLAIVIVKHLYGGLGQNPFNPAMVAFALMIVAYPSLMSQWPGAGQLDNQTQIQLILGGERVLDAITSATPLDALRTGLRSPVADNPTVASVLQQSVFGTMGGKGWELVSLGYLLGGLFLLWRGVISWHLPISFIATLAVIAGLAHLANPAQFASPLFHLASGGAMIGAFFIITDPVSGATTPRGKLIFAAGVALLTWVIRNFGAYPDGVVFGVLLMNLCAPLIDIYTQPPVFGHKQD